MRLARTLAFVLVPTLAIPCATVPRSGETVALEKESIILVWDARTKTEHLIRRATFGGKARDFGFLVPTPARPELGESKDGAFDRLNSLAAEGLRALGGGFGGAGGGARGGVTVIETKRVAGYDAAVLAADDTGALSEWLERHEYPTSPALERWYAPYVEKGWTITAFKIAKPSEPEARVETAAVRMSFRTERPFFPYREPQPTAGERLPARQSMRILYLGEKTSRAFLGYDRIVRPWAVEIKRQAVPPEWREALVKDLGIPAEALAERPLLTVFDDKTAQRPDHDLVFLE